MILASQTSSIAVPEHIHSVTTQPSQPLGIESSQQSTNASTQPRYEPPSMSSVTAISSRAEPDPSTGRQSFAPRKSAFSFSYDGALRKSRAVQACTECRRRKIKCDRVFPCSGCKSRNEENLCEEYVKQKAAVPTGYTLIADFLLLCQRVEDLEDHLQGLPAAPGGNIVQPSHIENNSAFEDWLGTIDKPDHPPPQVPSGGFFAQDTYINPLSFMEPVSEEVDTVPMALPVSEADRQPSSPEGTEQQEAALALEDIALNRSQRHMQTASGIATPAFTSRFLIKPSLGHLISLRRLVGEQATGDLLIPAVPAMRLMIRTFVDRFLWLHRCLHVPSLLHEVEILLSTSAQMYDDFLVEAQRVPFLALLFSIFATTAHLSTVQEASSFGLLGSKKNEASSQWSDASHTLLHRSDWLQRHSVESLQTVIIAGPYLNAVDRGEMHWSLVGSAIKVAQALGMCKLLAEEKVHKEARDKVYGPRFRTVLQREVGRRIWANLLEADGLFAAEHNYTHCIHPAQDRSAEPAHLNDADLVGQELCPSKSKDEWSETAYLLWRVKLIHPFRELVDNVLKQGSPTHAIVRRTHEAIQQIQNDLPAFFRFETDLSFYVTQHCSFDQMHLERMTIQSAIHMRLLRIHRNLLFQSYDHPKYQFSRQTCLDSARNLVNIGQTWIADAAHLGGRWWPVVFGLFSSGVVFCIELIEAKNVAAGEDLRRCISVIRELPDANNLRRAGLADLLQGLLDEAAKLGYGGQPYQGVQRKRKAGAMEDAPTTVASHLEHFVKRIAADEIRMASPRKASGLSADLPIASSSTDVSQTDINDIHPFGLDLYAGHSEDPFADILQFTSQMDDPTFWITLEGT